jgi:hypothetical protein
MFVLNYIGGSRNFSKGVKKFEVERAVLFSGFLLLIFGH